RRGDSDFGIAGVRSEAKCADFRGDCWIRNVGRRLSDHATGRKRRRGVSRDAHGLKGCKARAGRYRVCERAWNVDADRGRHRDAGTKKVIRGEGEASSGEFDEVDDRTFARWSRWTRSRYQRAGATRSDLASDDQSRSARSGVRPGLRSECGAQGVSGLCSIEFVWVWRYKRCAHFQPLDWQIAWTRSG